MKRTIFELAETDPIVHACIQEYERGIFTWEQALEHAVISLSNHAKRLQDIAEGLIEVGR